MNKMILKLKEINNDLVSPYHVLRYEQDDDPPVRKPLKIDTAFPALGSQYFDLVAVNILLANNKDIVYRPPVEIVELACSLFRVGNRRCNIFRDDQVSRVYNALAYNKVPDVMLVHQFLIQVTNYEYETADLWFSYMLLLFGLADVYKSKNHPYRSRRFVSYANKCYLTRDRKEHEHDLTCDNLRVLSGLKQLISECAKDKRYQNEEYILYMLDSIRIYVVIYLAALIRRSCTWKEFTPLGDLVLCQKVALHEGIVRTHHELHKRTGAVNET